MPTCANCRAETQLSPQEDICVNCLAKRERIVVAADALRRARIDLELAMQEIQRLKDTYIDVSKPSPDGDLALALARRIYQRAQQRVGGALTEYLRAVSQGPQ